MNAGSAFALTVAVVALGRWARDTRLEPKVILALGFIGLVIAVLKEGNDKFARQFATLILVGAVAMNGRDVFDKFNPGTEKGVGKADRKPLPSPLPQQGVWT